MLRSLQRYTLNHNQFQGIERGEWRKYNPYNPYVPNGENKKQEDNLKIDSLDDLFEDMAMDISTDISVLKTLFKQEGLTEENDFENKF